MPWVILFATSSGLRFWAGRIVACTRVLSQCLLCLAWICGGLAEVSCRMEALSNKQASNVLDLGNFVLGSLRRHKDDQQLLALICSIKTIQCGEPWVMAMKGG
jgi:hypothetical protein